MKHLIALYIFFLCQYVFVQQYETYNINYGVDEGLPSSECYQIIQDKKGYIWFGTDRGVVKYNGYEFKTYTTKQGLNNNVVFYIAEGPDDKIWFYDFENKLSYFENDSIYHFKYNHILEKKILKSTKPIGINIDQKSNIYFNLLKNNPNSPPIKSISMKGEVKYYNDYSSEVIFEKKQQFINTYMGFNKSTTLNNIKKIKIAYHKGLKSFFNELKFELGFYNSIPRCVFSNNKVYFSLYNALYIINENGYLKKIHQFEKGIYEIKQDHSGNIYVGLNSHGLWVLPNGKNENIHQIISNCSVSSVLIDQKKGIWLSTLEKGLLYLPYRSFSQHLSSKNKLINHIEGIDDHIVYSDYPGNLYELNSDSKLKLGMPYPTFIKKLKFINKDTLFASLISAHSYIYSNLNKKPILGDAPFEDILITDSNIYFVYQSILNKYSSKKNILLNSLKFPKHRLNCISNGFNNEILIGTNNGVYCLSNNQLIPFFKKYKLYNTRISNIKLYKDILITATRGNGIVIHKKNKKPYILNKKQNLISNEIHKIYIKNDRIYALSKEGFSLINYKNGQISISNYTNKNGLISNEVNDLYEYKNVLWIANNKGINRLDLLNDNNNSSLYPIYLTSFNYPKKLINKNAILNYNENKIEFSFEALSYINEGDINYRYKLLGNDKKWIVTNSRKLRYPNLPSGDFKFIISMQKPDKSWTKPILLFSIKIKKPFWNKIWFIIIIITSAILLISTAIYQYIKKLNKKLNTQRTILELERSALQAQMNPHFIFNSLASIQSLITQNKNESAEDFLIKFSRLVRTSLNQSSKTYISIEEEIEMINHYLEIESLRYDNTFEWFIEIDKEISIDECCIPPMIIQPFLENSLEHGINHIEDKGIIKIEITVLSDYILECVVTDNGIGLEKSKELKFKSTESKGIKLATDRLKIINKKSKITITDLNKTNNDSGTKVLIHLPYQNN